MGGEGLTPGPALFVTCHRFCSASRSPDEPPTHRGVSAQHYQQYHRQETENYSVGLVQRLSVLEILQKHFLEAKGSELWSAICEEGARRVPPPCQIKLAKSEVDRDCLLLILVGERGQSSCFLCFSLMPRDNDLDLGNGRGGCSVGRGCGTQILSYSRGRGLSAAPALLSGVSLHPRSRGAASRAAKGLTAPPSSATARQC